MTDPLAIFYTQPISVRRYAGDGAYGPVHDTAVTLYGRVKELNKLVVDKDGNEVVSSTEISLSITTARIPVGSLARRTANDPWRPVIAESRHIGGFPRSPDYYSINLA